MQNNILREIRKEVGMSVSELARRSDVSRQTITNIELHGQDPSGFVMIKISNALKRDPRDIFFINSVSQVKQINENKQAI